MYTSQSSAYLPFMIKHPRQENHRFNPCQLCVLGSDDSKGSLHGHGLSTGQCRSRSTRQQPKPPISSSDVLNKNKSGQRLFLTPNYHFGSCHQRSRSHCSLFLALVATAKGKPPWPKSNDGSPRCPHNLLCPARLRQRNQTAQVPAAKARGSSEMCAHHLSV